MPHTEASLMHADWQAVHKGPPGWELSQGVPLALNGGTGEAFKRVVR